jgi:ABC-type polysaccharide/polyol phosphate export permease
MSDKKPLLLLAVLAAIIQFSDGFIGVYERDLSKVIGPFVLAALTFIGIFMNWRAINPAGR